MAVIILELVIGVVLVAMCSMGFKLNLRTRSFVVAVAVLFAMTIWIGCGGGTTPSGAFSGSPASGATTTSGGSSTSAASANSTVTSSFAGSVSSMEAATTSTASWVKGVTFASTSIAAGASSSGTVALNGAAPAGGAKVALTSSKASVASVPTSVMVAAGQTSGTFTVTAGNVSTDTLVTIAASYNNTFAGNTVTVRASATPPPPPTAVSISISPSSASLLAGASLQFTAAVTGSTNTAVSWKATSGTITTTGRFTAPYVSASTMVTVSVTSQADPSKVKTAQVTVTPLGTQPPPPPPSGGAYSGTGPVASWKAYQYKDTDGLYHQAIKIYNAQGAYPVIGYSYSRSDCTNLGDRFNDYWQPLGNGLWWFINRADLVYVKWVWYDNATNRQILQQTPCINYSGAPKYN